MREIKKLVDSKTAISVLDEQGQGGANHHYEVLIKDHQFGDPDCLSEIRFQNGPIQEFGVNGCTNEDLLYIIADRLECFQKGNFSCRENAIALTHIQEAIMWLERRTLERIQRNVEGLNIK